MVKSIERYYRIASVDSQISHTQGNGRQLEEAQRRLAIEDSSLVIKGVWWINRESANISRIKASSTIYATLYRNGWAGARRTVKSKQNWRHERESCWKNMRSSFEHLFDRGELIFLPVIGSWRNDRTARLIVSSWELGSHVSRSISEQQAVFLSSIHEREREIRQLKKASCIGWTSLWINPKGEDEDKQIVLNPKSLSSSSQNLV